MLDVASLGETPRQKLLMPKVAPDWYAGALGLWLSLGVDHHPQLERWKILVFCRWKISGNS